MHVSWKTAPAREAAAGPSTQTARGRWALVPAKPFALAKTRLSARLAPRHRAALAREMLTHTLRALGQVETLEGVALVSTEPEAEALAREWGAHVLPERPGHLASVIDAGLAALGAAELVIVVLADLPRLQANDVADMLALSERSPIVLAPDTRDEGTNALLLRPPTRMPTCFGRYGSFAAHLRRATTHRLDAVVHRRYSLGFDLDSPHDLDQLIRDRGRPYAALTAAGVYDAEAAKLRSAGDR